MKLSPLKSCGLLSFIYGGLIFSPPTYGLPTQKVAECQTPNPSTLSASTSASASGPASPFHESIELKFSVLRNDESTLVVVDQKHPRFPEPTQHMRHVQERITHDFWEYSNHYDFNLTILPGQKGEFSGNLSGVHYQKHLLNCHFSRLE